MRKVTSTIATVAASLVAGLAVAAPAQAAGSSTYTAPGCPTRTTSAMLSQFGDTNQYFEAGAGGSAQYSKGWTGLYSISAENEPWTDRKSVV